LVRRTEAIDRGDFEHSSRSRPSGWRSPWLHWPRRYAAATHHTDPMTFRCQNSSDRPECGAGTLPRRGDM
jgi:hypothetical protein